LRHLPIHPFKASLIHNVPVVSPAVTMLPAELSLSSLYELSSFSSCSFFLKCLSSRYFLMPRESRYEPGLLPLCHLGLKLGHILVFSFLSFQIIPWCENAKFSSVLSLSSMPPPCEHAVFTHRLFSLSSRIL
ncbi:mCG144916, partial [Mus musculus]